MPNYGLNDYQGESFAFDDSASDIAGLTGHDFGLNDYSGELLSYNVASNIANKVYTSRVRAGFVTVGTQQPPPGAQIDRQSGDYVGAYIFSGQQGGSLVTDSAMRQPPISIPDCYSLTQCGLMVVNSNSGAIVIPGVAGDQSTGSNRKDYSFCLVLRVWGSLNQGTVLAGTGSNSPWFKCSGTVNFSEYQANIFFSSPVVAGACVISFVCELVNTWTIYANGIVVLSGNYGTNVPWDPINWCLGVSAVSHSGTGEFDTKSGNGAIESFQLLSRADHAWAAQTSIAPYSMLWQPSNRFFSFPVASSVAFIPKRNIIYPIRLGPRLFPIGGLF